MTATTALPISSSSRRRRRRHTKKDTVRWLLMVILLFLQLLRSFGWAPPLSSLSNHHRRYYHHHVLGASFLSKKARQSALYEAAPPPRQQDYYDTNQQDHPNDSINNKKKKTKNTPTTTKIYSSHTLTPVDILYRAVFASKMVHQAVPLSQALRLIRDALQVFVEDTISEESIRNRLQLDPQQQQQTTLLIRIEQAISHPVDPLAWLCAQHSSKNNNNNNKQQSQAFYLRTEEDDFEVATLESVLTVNTTTVALDMLTDLPRNAQWYGGARFDSTGSRSNQTVEIMAGQEWNSFGAALWMLPSIELKRHTHPSTAAGATTTTTLAVHLVVDSTTSSLASAAQQLLQQLAHVTHYQQSALPCTTLPPIISRASHYFTNNNNGSIIDGQELFEQGLQRALQDIASKRLDKIVLARRQTLQFAVRNSEWSALTVLQRWKYGQQQDGGGGHLFYLQHTADKEFFGCTPERLFRVGWSADHHASGEATTTKKKKIWTVQSEALAGTRPRGRSQSDDDDLLQELVTSPKDRSENIMTGTHVQEQFHEMQRRGWIQQVNGSDSNIHQRDGFFVRRLLHLQHICQRFSAPLLSPECSVNVTSYLLHSLHPTPAVGGVPVDKAQEFIRSYESVGFDRGFYSGPIGYMGATGSDILVAIRSGLATTCEQTKRLNVHVYAGVGIVAGSTLHEEWAETNYKLAVLSSIFPQSPFSLQSAPNANVAWATAFIEELIRNGVTQFYVCPGSRSTPLVVAIARAARSNVGVVQAVSVHDERAAGFRAVGYGRGAGRPAAVITSSGTAVANLYPAIVEAGMDAVPMIVLTADRPYESRNTGANQAIDQVKIFSSAYVRWFRDVLPPDDQVPVSVALSDATHAVSVSRESRGPVHVNIQFRENLAPDAGQIRNDNRAGAITEYNGVRFTDVPGFQRWSTKGGKWTETYGTAKSLDTSAVNAVVDIITGSRRGLIVVGNLREMSGENQLHVLDAISSFAQSIGFPIVAGAHCVNLRFCSSAVVPFADHLLKCPEIAENLQPDLVLQFGAPLVSTAISSVIESSGKSNERPMYHVLVHPAISGERYDPGFTVTHNFQVEIESFVDAVSARLSMGERMSSRKTGSELTALLLLGRRLRNEMKTIVQEAASTVTSRVVGRQVLTEPELVIALSEKLVNERDARSFFMSNSMPIRDCEFFMYPLSAEFEFSAGPVVVGANRGASGIDGIIATAHGFAESTGKPTTLLIGDLATLHDLTSLRSLTEEQATTGQTGKCRHPLTTLIVNNNGGGIFSFLPIAKHGADASFTEFFGTPTESFSFEKGASAFGLDVEVADTLSLFKLAFGRACNASQHTLIEVKVANHEINVAMHQEITKRTNSFIREYLHSSTVADYSNLRLGVKRYGRKDLGAVKSKTLVLLHGWMGDKLEWHEVASMLSQRLEASWEIVAVDLPGHGEAPAVLSLDRYQIRSALNLVGSADEERNAESYSIDYMAATVLNTLSRHHGVKQIHGVVGYSLGGRVAVAMKRMCDLPPRDIDLPILLRENAKVVLLSADPGDLSNCSSTSGMLAERLASDHGLASEMRREHYRMITSLPGNIGYEALWSAFLSRWYSSPIWGNLTFSGSFDSMIERRSNALQKRGLEMACVLENCSPLRTNPFSWKACQAQNTVFMAGSLDTKYKEIGAAWKLREGVVFTEVANAGHALLVEAPSVVVDVISDVLGTSEDAVELVEEASEEALTSMHLEKADTVRENEIPRDDLLYHESTQKASSSSLGVIDTLSFEEFSISLINPDSSVSSVVGIGWGSDAHTSEPPLNQREGMLIQVGSSSGLEVGLGEVSPLKGLHPESLNDAKEQILKIQSALEVDGDHPPAFSAASILAMDGTMNEYLRRLALFADIDAFLPSVRSGLEMALLSFASQLNGYPLHQSMSPGNGLHTNTLPVNGIIVRRSLDTGKSSSGRKFPSLKVKVGHQSFEDDLQAVSIAYRRSETYQSASWGRIRADANRAWNESEAMEFVTSIDGVALHAIERFEFVEEPLEEAHRTSDDLLRMEAQVEALERFYMHSGIRYALDETIAELVEENGSDFELIKDSLSAVFGGGQRGCAAFVLKPALLGVELSLRIARLARSKLQIGCVFSSSFDTGVGLAYTALLGSLSDEVPSLAQRFPHGVGTFVLQPADTLSPSFSSYVNNDGILNLSSLSRALYGLTLDDIRDSLGQYSLLPAQPQFSTPKQRVSQSVGSYEAATSSSARGSKINVVVSLPLPFSAQIAASRFTDLPQQSRWSPWISSVAYQGEETEWRLNVKGIPLTWRAKSQLLVDPLGIEWESVSGVSNKGSVEFLEQSIDACLMKVQITMLTPRLLRPLFQGTSVFLEEFIRDKLLRWSLEMFRDVVKADLALERGDVELGDALYSAVEGKASAIEATLDLTSLPALKDVEFE